MVEKYKWLPNALFVDVYGEHVKSLVAQTMQWCEQHDSPLLVPLSKWLESPESLLITHVEHLDGGTDKLAITSYNQHVFFSTRNHEICMYHVPSKKLVRKLGGHSDRINFVLLSYNNKFLLSGSDDKTLKVWDATSGQETLTLKGHMAGVMGVAFSPDGKRIVSGSVDKTLKVWDATSGEETLTLKGHTG